MKNTAKKMAGYCKLIYGNNNSLTGTFLLSSWKPLNLTAPSNHTTASVSSGNGVGCYSLVRAKQKKQPSQKEMV